MKFLISPSKTQKIIASDKLQQPPLFLNRVEALQSFFDSLTPEVYSKSAKIDLNKAQQMLINMQNSQPTTIAISAYTGLVFKQLELKAYTAAQMNFIEHHVMIISAFYGLLRAHDGISAYRLDLKMPFKGFSFLNYWKPIIKDYIKQHQGTYISLASKEFNALFDPNDIIVIDFVVKRNDQLLRQSTMMKQIRGQFLNEIIKQQVNSIKALLALNVNGFSFCACESSDNCYVFMKVE